MYKLGDCRYENLLARKEKYQKFSLGGWQRDLISYNRKFALENEAKSKQKFLMFEN